MHATRKFRFQGRVLGMCDEEEVTRVVALAMKRERSSIVAVRHTHIVLHERRAERTLGKLSCDAAKE